MTGLLIPLLCGAVGLWALGRGADLFPSFARGAGEGLRTLLRIFPALLLLLPMIRVLRASGLLEALTDLCAPFLTQVGIPSETVPILLLRPISGSGALAVAADIMAEYGPDSLQGRTAAVMLGSTETTFYVLTVYLSSTECKDTKRILPAALLADCVGFWAAAAMVHWWFS